MHADWAGENLQVIRTLMERSALYRRALAPVMLLAGLVGIGSAVAAEFLPANGGRSFVLHWLVTALVAALGAFLLIRRQALQDKEAFWTPPTRRVTRALLPPFLAGAVLGILMLLGPAWNAVPGTTLPGLWMILYGNGLHAAGFFMVRGIRWLGWIFVLCGLAALALAGTAADGQMAHRLMGVVFGAGQLFYGVYLYFTERKNVA